MEPSNVCLMSKSEFQTAANEVAGRNLPTLEKTTPPLSCRSNSVNEPSNSKILNELLIQRSRMFILDFNVMKFKLNFSTTSTH